MRITAVIPWLGRGGAERVLSTLATAWAEHGDEVTVITFYRRHDSEYPMDPSVRIRYLDIIAPSKHVFQALVRNLERIGVLRAAIRESRPDVVVSFIAEANVLTLLATRRLGFPVIVSERSSPIGSDAGLIWTALRLLVYPVADAVVCQTRSTAEWFQTRTRIKAYVIPNMVDPPPDSATTLDSQNSDPKSRVLIAMGRLDRSKGFDLLLNAFSRI